MNVHDFGEVRVPGRTAATSSPLFYFVMEYVDGASLREVLQSDGMATSEAAAVVEQVCGALQYAHNEGVVHRDIKPENILLDRRGRIKIADFGLARLVSRSSDAFTLTGTHQVMGTPRYMAPEQMAGSRDVDHRADIYSLGVVFYEMLTGTLPLGSFDPPSIKAGVDVQLDAVVLKALATDPQRRYQRVSELAVDLHGVASLLDSRMSLPENRVQPWPGPSTILENAVGRAFDQVRDGAWLSAVRNEFAPALLAILVSILQMAMSAYVLWLKYASVVPRNREWATPLSVIETPALVVGLAALSLTLLLFGLGTWNRFRRLRPWLIFVAAIVTLMALAAPFSRGPFAELHVQTGRGTAQTWLAVTSVLCVGMLFTGAWDLRRSFTVLVRWRGE